MSTNSYKYKVIIFAHPRSGSTSLAKVLDLSPDIDMAIEPMHPSYGKWHLQERSYIETIKDTGTLEQALQEIFLKHNAMKILSYQLPKELYRHMLNIPDLKVIFLRRTNILKAIVSVLIAEQTQIWQKSDFENISGDPYHAIAPLPIDGPEGIRSRLKAFKEDMQYWDSFMSQKAEDTCIKITYEDLFEKGMGQSLECMDKIFEFLRITKPDNGSVAAFTEPEKQRINSKDTYKLVPNIEKINKEFGDKINGFLY